MRGSRNFRQGGGGPGQPDKKSSDNVLFFFFFLFSPQLILQKSNGQFHFSRFQRGSNIIQGGGGGGVQLLPGGSNCLFPIETHITCDFPGGGGSGPPVPPSGSALAVCLSVLLMNKTSINSLIFYFDKAKQKNVCSGCMKKIYQNILFC